MKELLFFTFYLFLVLIMSIFKVRERERERERERVFLETISKLIVVSSKRYKCAWIYCWFTTRVR